MAERGINFVSVTLINPLEQGGQEEDSNKQLSILKQLYITLRATG